MDGVEVVFPTCRYNHDARYPRKRLEQTRPDQTVLGAMTLYYIRFRGTEYELKGRWMPRGRGFWSRPVGGT